MKKYTLLIILIISAFLLCSPLFAQQILPIHVDSFEKRVTGEALMNQRKDHNGDVCALIRVITRNLDDTQRKRIQFYSDATTQILDLTYPVGIIQFYISPAAEYLEIAHPDFSMTRYVFKEIIESKRDYEMVISSSTVETIIKPSVTDQYLVLSVTPKNATVKIDGALVPNEEGVAQKRVKIGKHNYEVSAPLYYSENQTVDVTSDSRKEIQVSLKPNFGYLSVSTEPENGAIVLIDNQQVGTTPFLSDKMKSGTYQVQVVKEMYKEVVKEIVINDDSTTTITLTMPANFAEPTFTTDADAEIWIDNELKGKGTWSGRMVSGTYNVESRKESHRNAIRSITLENNDRETYAIGSPKPIHGVVDINTTPIGATITIDGKNCGTTPNIISDVLIGKRTVTLSKEGYATVSKNITVKETEQIELQENLSSTVTVSISSKPSNATVKIDGNAFGNTPLRNTLSIGKHHLRISHKDGVAEKSINVSENNTNFHLNLNPWRYFIGYNVAVPLTENFELMPCEIYVGMVKKAGFYLKFKTNFNFSSTKNLTENYLKDDYYYEVTESKTKRMGIIGGVYVRTFPFMYLYGGLGYGMRTQIVNVKYTSYTDYKSIEEQYLMDKYETLEIDLGLTFKIKKLTISCGFACIGSYCEVNAGVGVMF